MKKRIFSILFAMVMAVSLCLIPAVASAGEPVVLLGGVYTHKLFLENKDPTDWSTITDFTGATLGYNASGPEFVWALDGKVPTDGTYALIYYADKPDRFVNWGGNNPGALIATVEATDGGFISAFGSINLDMDLPCPPDANQFEHDYSGAPDYYVHAHGAKIWLVPVGALSAGGLLPVKAWPPNDNWLFETDLIWYDDTDVVSNVVGISVSPGTIDFGILTPGNNAVGDTITVTNTGNIPTGVTAELANKPITGVFKHLILNGVGRPNLQVWSSIDLAMEALAPASSAPCSTALNVPSGYTAAGEETATLIFWAEGP